MIYDNWKVQTARKRLHVTQADVAPWLGLRQSQLSLKETGKEPFTTEELSKLAELYGEDLDAFKPGK